MSEFHARIAWPVQAVPARAPDIAPSARHDPPSGLGAFDWRWRHGLALRREMRALLDEQGYLETGGACDATTRRRATALLRGNYVVIPSAGQPACVALAAVAAARAGIDVHMLCADDESVGRVLAQVEALEPAAEAGGPPLAAALRGDSMAALVASLSGPRIVCGTANAFALAWLRGNGARSVLQRAAARLAGDESFTFPFAPLLLMVDADRILLELVRQPLQLTASEADAQSTFLHEVSALVDTWQAGEHYERSPVVRLLPAGEAALAQEVRQRAGLWAIASLVQSEVLASVVASGLVADRHYSTGEQGFRWLVPQAEVLAGTGGDDAAFSRIERALRCSLGLDKSGRTRLRAWLPEYLLGYSRSGAAGVDPGPEWRDVWWLTGMPVVDSVAQRPGTQWMTLQDALAPDVTVAFGLRALQAGLEPRLAGMPPERFLCLERPEDRQRAAALVAEGRPVQVIGPPASQRHLPPGVSAIILLADAPALPGSLPRVLARLALRASSRGAAGRWLAAMLGRLALARQAGHQRKLRMALVERMRQDRKTYAFTGRPRDLT